MPTTPLSVVLQHLLADLRLDEDGRTDGELLARFLRSRDDDALAALVRRHAPMVWSVCRRLLNHHDAEDAFQAAFLVLVRKASHVPRQAVANWLYGVARQTAVRLRATAAKRGRRETQAATMPEPTVLEVGDAELQTVVDEEVSRLPDHYRGVVVLCDLEGMTRKEAARQLGIPEGSAASRLARARALLAKRLAQRGVVFSGGSAAAVLSVGSASASLSPALVASTIKAASLLAAGQAAGVVSAKVAALTEGVMKAMFATKLNGVLAAVLAIAAVAGATGLIYQTQAAEQPRDSNKVVQAPKAADKEVPAPAPATPAGKTPPNHAKYEQPPDTKGRAAPVNPEPDTPMLLVEGKDVFVADSSHSDPWERLKLAPGTHTVRVVLPLGFWSDHEAFLKASAWKEFGIPTEPLTPRGGIEPVSNAVAIVVQKGKAKIEAPEWGEAVQGLRIRLRPDKVEWGAGEAPTFRLDVSNKGKESFAFSPIQQSCILEIDGKRYRNIRQIDCPITPVEPGAEIAGWVQVSLDDFWVEQELPKPAPEAKQQSEPTDQERMDGNWIVVNEDSQRKGEFWAFTEDSILMDAKNTTPIIRRYSHRLDPCKTPRQIDITVTKVNGPLIGVIKGIYSLDDDELRLCLAPMDKARPAAFPEKPGPGEVLILNRTPLPTKKEKLRVLIDKVLAAHGGEAKLNKLQFTMTVKHNNGETQLYLVQPPKNFRWETTHPDWTSKRIVILFPKGRRWWTKELGGDAKEFIPTGAERRLEYWLDYVKFFGPREVLRLKDADHKLALLDEEVKIGGRAAVGVEVTGSQFNRKMYFDRETHLLLRSGAVTYSDYKTFDGIPIAQKEDDGYFMPQVTEFKVVEKFDAKLFEQP
jgi:RNA polymerase sigma factor (sigma-70 family)